VNDEFGELIAGLQAAERALKPGGRLAVVTFHSLEDRVVKRFFQTRSGGAGRANRYAPEAAEEAAQFRLLTRRAVTASEQEVAANPRSRSAKLRVAVRTDAPVTPLDRTAMGLPGPKDWWKETP
jgi:16S rRNA (cytosine1402-N4)-methyltransferase